MKAVVVRQIGGPDVLKVESVAEPELRADEVLIQVAACGVCFHDVVVRNGIYRRAVRLPLIPGHEVAGIVRAVGTAVTRFKPGSRVATTTRRHVCGWCRHCRKGTEMACAEREPLGDGGFNGGYAELVAVGHENVALVPDEVPLDRAALAGCALGCQLNAVRDVGRVRPGESVLVTGAGGGVGIHGVQLARLAGARVIAVTTSEAKVDSIRAAGAHDVVLTRRGEDFSENVRAATDGQGVNVAIDNVGAAIFHPIRRSLATGGRWVLVGELSGKLVSFNLAQLFLRGISLRSTMGASRAHLEDALALLRLGQVTPVVTLELSFEEARLAHAMIEAAATNGRVLLKPSL